MSSADVTTREEESEEEKEDGDRTAILPVTNALDRVNELIASFDNADETIHRLNETGNFLYSKTIENAKRTKIDNFFE